MTTKNFSQMMANVFIKQVSTSSKFNIKRYDGTSADVYGPAYAWTLNKIDTSNSFYGNTGSYATKGMSMRVGIGTTEPTKDDYCLAGDTDALTYSRSSQAMWLLCVRIGKMLLLFVKLLLQII